ncbi:NADH dehydrogenase [Amycolatopsis bartoniae]|uniref:Pyridine nucleotide-disulfide oxidoreductase n=1 Tax=Amycolatopsis bartoniae TaxID=941986 RepID=A0A8H9M826_9PSEU|nr:NAD(P)/FAD-dependent oxidoreductase [Amycolatopsis bartoniae]MBB2938686.1 NADH dehydrogenase [Amycolatopsis bartoniae]TVT11527.1 NAD(P)/FAD-dependent oxidoreductase [Amycolatopsis bartoniae]GHF79422.1 pyridine nucleotide-disulfide oxidoreductase [Amycolatopsis bartoniae]
MVETHEVVIVGAGFAGVSAAKELASHGVDVLLVDKNNYHQFQPLIYQVATAQIANRDVARPLRAIFRRDRSVKVTTAEVTKIDAGTRTVTTSDGLEFRGRILVIATGAEVNFFGIPGADEHAFPLYSLDDAARLRSRLLGALDAADRDRRYVEKGALNVVIVGGGATGVETAGAVAESMREVVPAYLSKEVAASGKVYLVDMLPDILMPFSEKSRKYAAERLRAAGVELKLGVSVTEVRKDGVLLKDGTFIPSRTVVWAGGLKARGLLGDSGLPQGKGGRIDVGPELTVPGFEGVYALGDSANITDAKGQKLPQLGSVAQQSGKWVARNILADLRGGRREPFVYRDKGIMAMIGRGAAIAELGSKHQHFAGPLAFLAWLGVHVALMSGVRERIGAVVSWFWDYGTRRRPQIVVDRPDAYRIDWSEPEQGGKQEQKKQQRARASA